MTSLFLKGKVIDRKIHKAVKMSLIIPDNINEIGHFSVAMITDDFLPANTGAGIIVQKNCLELVRLGFKIIVLTSRKKGQPPVETWQGITIYRFLSMNVYGFSQALPTRGDICRILLDHEVNIIHVHYLSFMTLQALVAARGMGCRLIYTAHMSLQLLFQPIFMKPLKPLITKIYLEICDNFDDIVCVSTLQARHFRQFNIRSRIHVISSLLEFNGDESAALPQEDRFVVMFAGRLSPEKNVGYLLAGFALLAKSRPKVELWIAGKGIEENRLRQEAKDLGIEKQVRFWGHIAHKNLPDLYATANVFVLPSVSETLGMVALEAMCFRKPVIVLNCIVSARELVAEKENGFIVDPSSPQELADRLGYLYDHPEVCRKMGEAGYLRSRGSSSESVGRHLQELYLQKNIENRSKPPQGPLQALWNFDIEWRKTCVYCGVGRFEENIRNSSVSPKARTFQNEYFKVWRCPSCLSIHSLPKVSMEDYNKKSPYQIMRINPYIVKAFSELCRFFLKHGIACSDRVLICAVYCNILVGFMKGRGFSSVEGHPEMITAKHLADAPEHVYDMIFADDYLERSDEPGLVFQWFFKVLKPGGLLFLNCTNSMGIDLARPKDYHLSQPYRIHIPSMYVLRKLAKSAGLREKGIWPKHYLDTYYPFVNYRAMNTASCFMDNSLDAGFEFRPWQIILKPWLIPWYLMIGLLGGVFPDKGNMFGVFEKRTQAGPFLTHGQ